MRVRRRTGLHVCLVREKGWSGGWGREAEGVGDGGGAELMCVCVCVCVCGHGRCTEPGEN